MPTTHAFRIKSSFLTRDRKLFLQLSQAEVDCWVPRVFDKIRPQLVALSALLFQENEPANLTLILDLTMDEVREVARDMADNLLTPRRLAAVRPLLERYCDDLLATDRQEDAAFIQAGLLRLAGCAPAQNPLLVEICAQALYQQIEQMNMIGRSAPKIH